MNTQKTKLVMTVIALGFMAACAKSPESERPTLSLMNEQQNSIVNGKPVSASELAAKSTVALYYSSGTRFAGFCTGTLIARDVVLTAAHCIADFAEMVGVDEETLVSGVSVGFGTQIAKSPSDARAQLRLVKSATIHPKYVTNSVGTATRIPMYDVAILKLKSAAPTTAKTATLLKTASTLKVGTPLVLVGFGLTNGVTETEATSMNKVDVVIDNPKLTVAQFTYKTVDGKSSCSGDSGGPAYLTGTSGTLTVAGVTSWGDSQCVRMGAYTSVAAVAAWITKLLPSL